MSTGFDAPEENEEADRLDRRIVADRILSLLTEAPSDWSLRVGLLGEWGEGKTTVAKWVATRASKQGHVVVWYNPWSAHSEADLWFGFAVALFEALEKAGIEVEGSRRLRANVGIKKWSEWPRKLSQASKVSETAFSLVEGVIRIGKKDIRTVRSKLGSHRVVVIIDDTDRVDPNLLPSLLLTVRNVLDLEGFSFLLPFDEAVVSATLGAYNPAWGSGTKFLDKILDFKVSLPEPTSAQCWSIFSNVVSAVSSSIPVDRMSPISDSLPKNPRRLKAVVRALATFGREVSRYGVDDVDWLAIVFALMIKQESPAFFAAYTQETFREVTTNIWLSLLIDRDDATKTQEKERIRLLLEKYARAVPETHKRIYELCENWRRLHGLAGFAQIRNSLRLLDCPPTLNKTEVDTVLAEWLSNERPARVTEWITFQAKSRHITSHQFVADLFSFRLNDTTSFWRGQPK